MKKLFFSILCVGIFLMAGCTEGDDRRKDDRPVTNDGYAVVVMEPETVMQHLQSISDDGTLTFSSLPKDETPVVGDIICSGITENAPYGFLYRVKKVSTKNGNTVIETSEASLEEAIENGDFSKTFNLDEYIIGIDDHKGNPIKLSSLKSSQTRESLTIAYPFDISVKQAEGTISLKGSVTLENELVFDISAKDFSIDYIQMVYKMKQEVQATLVGELEGEAPLLGENGFTIASIHLAPITFMMGPVPVVISHDILLVLKIDFSGKMEVTIDAKVESSVELGVEYRNNQTKGIQKQTSNTTVEPKVALSGALTITAEPKYSASFFGMKNFNSVELFAGISVETRLSQEIAAIADLLKYGLNPEVAISRIIKAGIRAKLKLFSKKIMDVELSIELLNEVLIKSNVFPQFPDVEVTNFAMARATAYTPEEVMFNFILPVSQYGIVLSENPLPSIDNGWYNNLGAMPAMWTPATAPTASAFLQDLPGVGDLDKDKTYYVCVYFKNTFGTFYSKVTKYLDKDDDEDWVLINGVKWATRNVGDPGTFVNKPEDYGEYYQWNRGTTDMVQDYYDYDRRDYVDFIKANSWESANDPSPAGYRVPTLGETRSLCNLSYVSTSKTTRNGVTGTVFTDRTSGKSIFLPEAGFRIFIHGECVFVAAGGYYWSDTPETDDILGVYCLYVGTYYAYVTGASKLRGLSLRSVKD